MMYVERLLADFRQIYAFAMGKPIG